MDDDIRGGVCRFVMLGMHCRHFTWNGLEWPGITAMPNRCTKISAVPGTVTATVTATVTVTVTVNRLGALGPGCASCGLLCGYYEARRVEGWLSMLLRHCRLYCFRNKLMLNVPLLFTSK
jgi:hypothetical protein